MCLISLRNFGEASISYDSMHATIYNSLKINLLEKDNYLVQVNTHNII